MKGNIKGQITKLSNWKETNDSADIAAHLIVLEKLQKKFDDLKTSTLNLQRMKKLIKLKLDSDNKIYRFNHSLIVHVKEVSPYSGSSNHRVIKLVQENLLNANLLSTADDVIPQHLSKPLISMKQNRKAA
ncbi:hypothetical protein NPIL_650021 [Nephila pilipes]|uniref:Uncharacterized protein n=1 Tax=Nephila pilipes TaxID=299642 RepID=A0A8X6P074_NEPPI|nr:hypothetical protein NPIL_650021 [Nephila pilipes]